jgi:hypothetical protein
VTQESHDFRMPQPEQWMSEHPLVVLLAVAVAVAIVVVVLVTA